MFTTDERRKRADGILGGCWWLFSCKNWIFSTWQIFQFEQVLRQFFTIASFENSLDVQYQTGLCCWVFTMYTAGQLALMGHGATTGWTLRNNKNSWLEEIGLSQQSFLFLHISKFQTNFGFWKLKILQIEFSPSYCFFTRLTFYFLRK